MVDTENTFIINDFVSSLSNPFPGPDVPILNYIISQCSNTALEETINCCDEKVQHESIDMVAVCRTWINDYSIPWIKIVARMRRSRMVNSSEFSYFTLVSAALLANLAGVTGKWSFKLSKDQTLRIERWVFSKVISGKIISTDTEIVLNLEYEDKSIIKTTLYRPTNSRTWNIDRIPNNSYELPTTLISGNSCYLIPDNLVNEDLALMLVESKNTRLLSINELDNFKENIKIAVHLLRDCDDKYINWIKFVIKEISISTYASEFSSGSHPNHPGSLVIHNSAHHSTLAEMMIHESSHQYFYILSLIDPINSGIKNESFYSPLTGNYRTIERILLSYHALGNMVLFYQDYMKTGLSRAKTNYCNEQIQDFNNILKEYDNALNVSSNLTTAGEIIWQTLSNKLIDNK